MPVTFSYNTDFYPPAPFVEAIVGAKTEASVFAFIDSGADATMLPERILNQINATHIRSQTLRGITGHPVIVETYVVEVKIGDYSIPGIQAIASRTDEIIIGRDVLQHLIVKLDGIGSECEIS